MSRLNIVIPMAGRGSRFQVQGFDRPKPLILVEDQPMMKLAISNMKPKRDHRFIFLVLREHENKYQISSLLKKWSPGAEVVFVESVTEGAACTVLLAKDLIDNQDPLMIANSDQWVDFSVDEYLQMADRYDGLIMSMWADDPKWSFMALDAQGFVTKVVEKEVISNEASVGVYNFAHGSSFVQSALQMIEKNLRVNNEFYVAPTYNELIPQGAKVKTLSVGRLNEGMYGLGVPEDLEFFLKHPVRQKALSAARSL